MGEQLQVISSAIEYRTAQIDSSFDFQVMDYSLNNIADERLSENTVQATGSNVLARIDAFSAAELRELLKQVSVSSQFPSCLR